jgi:hypothetical protein
MLLEPSSIKALVRISLDLASRVEGAPLRYRQGQQWMWLRDDL